MTGDYGYDYELKRIRTDAGFRLPRSCRLITCLGLSYAQARMSKPAGVTSVMNWFKSFWKALTTPMPRDEPANPKPFPTPVRRESHEFLEPMNNFTPRAQQVLGLARREADRFNHNFVGTEHLLLG